MIRAVLTVIGFILLVFLCYLAATRWQINVSM